MKNGTARWWWGILCVVLATSCTSYATVATKTIEALGAAELVAAKAGADAHRKAIEALTKTAADKRMELGCPPAGDCADPAWPDFRADLMEKRDALKLRYGEFCLALRSLDAALSTTALGMTLNDSIRADGFDLVSAMAALAKAWGNISALLAEYGVKPPVLPGMKGGS